MTASVRRVRAISRIGFNNQLGRILESFYGNLLFVWLLALIISGVCIGIETAAKEQSLYCNALAVIGPACAILWTGYHLILARAQITNLISEKLLFIEVPHTERPSSDCKGEHLPAKFAPDSLTTTMQAVYWHQGVASSLAHFMSQLGSIDLVFLHLIMFDIWEGLNRSTLRIAGDAGDAEFYYCGPSNHITQVLTPVGAKWIEPWSALEGSGAHSVTSVSSSALTETTDFEACALIAVIALFWLGYLWAGIIATVLVSPFVLMRALRAYRVLTKTLQGFLLKQVRAEERASSA